MMPVEPAIVPLSPPNYLPVQIDGRVVGHLPSNSGSAIYQRLHALKATTLAMRHGNISNPKLPILQVDFPLKVKNQASSQNPSLDPR